MTFQFDYMARGGGKVKVPKRFKPHQELGIATSAQPTEIKEAYKRVVNHYQRQRRVMVSLAYYALTSKRRRFNRKSDGSFEFSGKADIFTIASVGDTDGLLAEIAWNESLLKATDERNNTVLYLTARCGFYDTTEALLKKGARVNDKQVDGSTPLHGASYYGHRLIVELLLCYDADATMKNKWGNTPADEAASDEIKEVIRKYKEDAISKVAGTFISKGLARRIQTIKHRGTVIGTEVVRDERSLDPETKRWWGTTRSTWQTVWHGTKAKYLESIFKNGLLPTGSRLPNGTVILPPKNHFQLGESHFGIDDWARAIFVSPSISYAAHVCYSERVFENNQQWCVLIKACVNPECYEEYDHTTFKRDPIAGEPDTPEYRIDVQPDDKVYRIESSRNVVVTSIMFISLEFFQNEGLTFEQLQTLFC